jgi:hypothetical protein
MRRLKIFIASPGDVKDERDIVSVVVEELRRTIGEIVQVELEPIRWETHSWPDVGDDAQDVINKEIGEYDVLVGVMWKRFGTPTNRASSGTGEEFERAYSYFKTYERPKIMFYFKNAPFYTSDLKEIAQFRKVIQFKQKLEQLGVFFWEYSDTLQFERRIREQLMKQIFQLSQKVKPKEKVVSLKLFLSYAREDRQRVEPIYDSLKAAGFSPWMDVKDILPGTNWMREIEKTIADCDFFLVFISQNTINKRGHIQREIDMALAAYTEHLGSDIHLIPVRLDPVEPPSPFAQFQWIDYFAPEGRQQLISAIKSISKERNIKGKSSS